MTLVAHTAELPDEVQRLIAADYDLQRVSLRSGESLPTGVAGLIVAPVDRLDAARIEALPSTLRVLASFSVGLDHIDLAAAARRGLPVTNTPDVLTEATADVAMLLIMSAVRGAGEAERLLRAGSWTGWTPRLVFGHDLAGRVLGVAGPGRIGLATARRALAFGMKLAYWGRSGAPAFDAAGAVHFADFETFLGAIDVLTLHVPSTPQTRRLVNAEAIAAMRRGACIVNTGRGDLIDDAALIAALHSGQIGGAGLDVFDGEPALNPGYLGAPRITLLPHIGSATHETRLAMGRSVLASLRRYLSR